MDPEQEEITKNEALLKFDVVDLEKPVGKELRESIEREGMVIYEEIWEFQGGIHVGKIINRKFPVYYK